MSTSTDPEDSWRAEQMASLKKMREATVQHWLAAVLGGAAVATTAVVLTKSRKKKSESAAAGTQLQVESRAPDEVPDIAQDDDQVSLLPPPSGARVVRGRIRAYSRLDQSGHTRAHP